MGDQDLSVFANPIQFGLGAVVVNTGHYGGKPAVFIARATEPGVVGEETGRAAFDRNTLQPGEVVMLFPTTEQANDVADAMCGATVTKVSA